MQRKRQGRRTRRSVSSRFSFSSAGHTKGWEPTPTAEPTSLFQPMSLKSKNCGVENRGGKMEQSSDTPAALTCGSMYAGWLQRPTTCQICLLMMKASSLFHPMALSQSTMRVMFSLCACQGLAVRSVGSCTCFLERYPPRCSRQHHSRNNTVW